MSPAAAPPAVDWTARGPLAVPLLTNVLHLDGKAHLVVWGGDGSARILAPPREPGMWSTTADAGRVAEVAMKRRLSDTTAPPSRWYRLAFDSLPDVREYVAQKRRAGLTAYLGDEDRWATRILVEEPDFYREHAMTRPLRILTVDIEQRSKDGQFPRRDAPLVSIALGRADGTRPRVVVARHAQDDEPDDEPCLRAWRRAIETFDPDIIAAFNAPFDAGVLVERGAVHGFPLPEWGRRLPNGEPAFSHTYVEKRGRGKGKTRAVVIGGRILWDVYKNANPVADYNLSGCKDFKLKTIGAFLGLPVITEDTSETLALWRDDPRRLVRYNANDVVLLEHLIHRYLRDRLALAEFYGAPLDMALDSGPGWGGTIASARTLYEAGILSDGTNFERHRAYLRGRAHDEPDPDDEDNGVMAFAGAHIVLYKRGLFRPIYKADFASLYPRVLEAIRCGPDNTRIVGTEPFGPFHAERDGERVVLHVPDTNYGHRWLIEVRGESVFTPILKARLAERLAAKKRGDTTAANILKTLLNAMFGTHGALFNRYGVLPVAIIAAGYGRELIKAMETPLGDTKIETDTDGVYLTRRPNGARLARVANAEAERWGFEPVFEVDVEEYAAGWFHKRKTYLLLTKDGKLKRYGGSMKGRAHPAIFDRVMEDVGRALLTEGREAALRVAKERLVLSKYERRDFVQRATLGRPLASYAHKTKEVKIALAHEATFGTPPTVGQSYEYVRTREGMVPPTSANLAQLDEHRYLDRVVLPALARLGFADLDELGIRARKEHLKARSKRPRGETSLFSYG